MLNGKNKQLQDNKDSVKINSQLPMQQKLSENKLSSIIQYLCTIKDKAPPDTIATSPKEHTGYQSMPIKFSRSGLNLN